MYIIYLILTITLFIYNVTGIYYVILFILAIINYIFASIHLLHNYDNVPIRLIQLICLGTILIIIALNIHWLILKLFIYFWSFNVSSVEHSIDGHNDVLSSNLSRYYRPYAVLNCEGFNYLLSNI